MPVDLLGDEQKDVLVVKAEAAYRRVQEGAEIGT
jgi:hypothetical protein